MRTKAAVLYSTGHSGPYQDSSPLVIEMIELDGPGPGEVMVEMAAAGLCHSDLSVINGTRPRVMPMVLGHEASGVVCDVGVGVRDLTAGDHVVFSFVPVCGHCMPCATGRPALCEPGARANVAGTLLNGTRRFTNCNGQSLNHHLGVSAFSQFTVSSQDSLVKIDPEVPLERAALFGCAVMTGVGAVFNTARVEPGSTVVVFGLGGVGMSVVMGARAAGAARVIAVDLVTGKLALARDIGADDVIDATTTDVVEHIREITHGGVDYAFECAGSESALLQAYNSTRRGGTTIALGLSHPSKLFSIPAVSLVMEERTIKGSYMGSAVPRRDIPRYIDMHRAGVLPVEKLLSGSVRLEEINVAFDALASGEAVRQVVQFAAT